MSGMQIVFAAKDPKRLAEFWRIALGYQSEPPPEGFASWEEFARANNLPPDAGNDIDSAVDPAGAGPRLLFERDDPEPRGRVHLDVNVGSREMSTADRKTRIDEAVVRLEAAGATRTRVVDRPDQYWIEMTDPEGNSFCVQ
jgi:Glyoxalase-like domain